MGVPGGGRITYAASARVPRCLSGRCSCCSAGPTASGLADPWTGGRLLSGAAPGARRLVAWAPVAWRFGGWPRGGSSWLRARMVQRPNGQRRSGPATQRPGGPSGRVVQRPGGPVASAAGWPQRPGGLSGRVASAAGWSSGPVGHSGSVAIAAIAAQRPSGPVARGPWLETSGCRAGQWLAARWVVAGTVERAVGGGVGLSGKGVGDVPGGVGGRRPRGALGR